MKIKIDISNPNSVKRAIQALERAKATLLDKVVEELAKECSNAIIERANERLYTDSQIGSGLILEIQASWVLDRVKNGSYVLRNVCDKAVYVEFGVGVVGEQDPHPNASSARYKYNMQESGVNHKLKDGSWIFRVQNIDLIDIGEKYVMARPNGEKYYESGRTVRTQGQPATMYLYNAIFDFIESAEPQKIWSRVSQKYFGDWVKP